MTNQANSPGSDQAWEELLQQLHKQPKAQPQPFFYARVHARLTAQAQPAGRWLPTWARRPAYVALLGLLVLVVSGDGIALHPAATSQYTNYPASLPASSLPR